MPHEFISQSVLHLTYGGPQYYEKDINISKYENIRILKIDQNYCFRVIKGINKNIHTLIVPSSMYIYMIRLVPNITTLCITTDDNGGIIIHSLQFLKLLEIKTDNDDLLVVSSNITNINILAARQCKLTLICQKLTHLSLTGDIISEHTEIGEVPALKHLTINNITGSLKLLTSIPNILTHLELVYCNDLGFIHNLKAKCVTMHCTPYNELFRNMDYKEFMALRCYDKNIGLIAVLLMGHKSIKYLHTIDNETISGIIDPNIKLVSSSEFNDIINREDI